MSEWLVAPTPCCVESCAWVIRANDSRPRINDRTQGVVGDDFNFVDWAERVAAFAVDCGDVLPLSSAEKSFAGCDLCVLYDVHVVSPS